jgi:hypothetical protein
MVGPQPLQTKLTLADDLIVSATSQFEKPGGLFSLSKGAKPLLHIIDRLETSGIWLDNELFVRSVQNPEHMILFFYSPNSIWSIATENLKQVHDVRYQFGQLYVVSTSTNEVVQLDSTGKVHYRWKFPGEGDAWHLNCLDLWDGRYVVSCFGKFEKEREFKGKWQNAGILFDLETEEILWDGLSLPHTPRIDDQGRQYICDSGKHKLLRRNSDGSDLTEVEFPGAFTRGMAFGKDHIYVGLSTLRGSLGNENAVKIPTARVAILERESLKPVGEIDLPCPEIYDLLVP